ncbi:hypothetical protein BGZ76_002202 [Entomortierella beljakovae]|nr:hypothetical protein BGZ76_002202 [Entomortierella beljakovae]
MPYLYLNVPAPKRPKGYSSLGKMPRLGQWFYKGNDIQSQFEPTHNANSMKFIAVLLLTLQLVHGVQRYSHSKTASLKSNKPSFEELYNTIEETRNRTGVPGFSVAVLHKGKLVFAEGFGKRNEYDPFTADTVSQLASVSKSFTAAAIGQLVAEGKVDWDTTPVSKYLPEFELEDPDLTSQITFTDMLSHRTGLPGMDIAWYWSPKPRIELIKTLKYVKMEKKLKSFLQYSNVMYSVAGEAAARVEGVSFEDLVRNKVLKPLGFDKMGFSEDMEKQPNYAVPYLADTFEDAQQGKFKRQPVVDMTKATAPSGDMYSSVIDLVRYGNVIMHYGEHDGKQVLNKESVEEMLTAHSIDPEKRQSPEFGVSSTYGMGFFLDSYKGNVMYHHSGHTSGYVSQLAIFPDQELVIGHLSNSDMSEFGADLIYHIADEVLDLPKTQDWIAKIFNKTRESYKSFEESADEEFPKIENKPPSHALIEFSGTYNHPVLGDVIIRVEKDEVDKESLTFKYDLLESTLEHLHYDTFVNFLRHGSLSFKSLLSFKTGQDGAIQSIVFNLFTDNDEFKKIK